MSTRTAATDEEVNRYRQRFSHGCPGPNCLHGMHDIDDLVQSLIARLDEERDITRRLLRATRWVRVEERLPKRRVPVIARAGSLVAEAYYDPTLLDSEGGFADWFDKELGNVKAAWWSRGGPMPVVTHWMPLPPPPAE